MDVGYTLDLRSTIYRLWAPTSTSRAFSAVAELLDHCVVFTFVCVEMRLFRFSFT